MKTPVRVGLIGLGFMGTTHYRIYRAHPLARVVAIADIDPAKRRGDVSAVTANIGDGDNTHPMDLTGLQVYEDGLDLIRDPEVDLVDICVPVYLHHSFALAALAAGKPVLCEKPLARTAQEAREIAAAAEQAGVPCMAGMCVRYWPEYAHALERVRSGEAGRVRSAAFKRISPNVDGNSWRNWFMQEALSGGALLDLHLHDVDFIRQLLGMPRSVTAFGVRGIRSDRGIDHVMTRYDYGDDSLVTAEGSRAPPKTTPFEMSFQIICEHMTLRFAADGYRILHEDGRIETPSPAAPDMPTGWHVEIDHLLDALVNGRAPRMPLDEVVEAIQVVEAEAESIETQQTVHLSSRKEHHV